MKDKCKQTPWMVLAVGLVIYIFCVINNVNVELYSALTLMITLSAWACINIALDSFNITHFIKIFAALGYLLAITVFFFSGVEEVSFPEGAVVFHMAQIVKSFGIAFIASLPLLYLYDNGEGIKKTTPHKNNEDSNDNWEAATQEDLDSGQWELEG